MTINHGVAGLVSALTGYPIKATDGELGTVAGMMYEQSDWTIRWLVVDTGGWLSGRQALLPVGALGQPDPQAHHMPVNLSMSQVESCPEVDAAAPLSPATETLMSRHYGLAHGRDRFLWGDQEGGQAALIAAAPAWPR